MAKKAKSKKSKSGVRVRDMKSRKDPKGGLKIRTAGGRAFLK